MTAAEGPPPAATRLAAALAEELVLASRILGDLAYDLGQDSETLRKHIGSLQAIDHVTQIQLVVADLLREIDTHATTLGHVPLQDMADRLRGTLAA
jgi:hypothetical protein